MFITIIAIIAIIIAAIFLYFRHHYTYWSRHGIPGPNGLQLSRFTIPHHIYCAQQTKKYGKIFGNYTLFGKELIVNEPDVIRNIMVKDFHIFPGHTEFNLGSTLFSKILVFLPGDDSWKRIRGIVSPAFTSGKLRSMMESMHQIADKLVDYVEKLANKNEEIDFREYIGAFAMDVITSCAYGVNVDSVNNPNHPIVVNAKKIFGSDASISLILSGLWPKLAKLLRLEPFNVQSIQFFDALTNNIVNERKSLNKDQKNKKSDFLQLMIDTEKQDEIETMNENETTKELGRNEESVIKNNSSIGFSKIERTLTSEELTAQGILFFIAGYDTTSATLTHCFYHLAKNPDIQQKLYEELLTISGDFSYEKLNNLEFLNGVLFETLRMCPPFLRIDRKCKQDYVLADKGIKISAGTSVVILPYSLHHDPEYFESPYDFKPERFLNPTHHPYAYIPFGCGQRNCVGMRFALNEMRVCVAKLVNKFKFHLKPGFEMEYFAGNLVFTPKHLMLSIKSRN